MKKTTYAGYSLGKKNKSVTTLTLPLDLEIIYYVSTAWLRRLLLQTQGIFLGPLHLSQLYLMKKSAANNGWNLIK